MERKAQSVWDGSSKEDREEFVAKAKLPPLGNHSPSWRCLDGWIRRRLREVIEGCGIHEDDQHSDDYQATYCPESNKLHLYVGRVAKQTYNHLLKCGYKSTPRQSENGGGEFAATWSIGAENAALALIPECDDIGDEDQGPADRAADRAERFERYRSKRHNEATHLANQYESGPSAFGHQNQARADRQAARHERVADKSLTQWEKAEYWQQRTQGVIDHALYAAQPHVRLGRIRTLESELRKVKARYTPHGDEWTENRDGKQIEMVMVGSKGIGSYPARKDGLADTKEYYARLVSHLEMRISYERMMIGEDGGRAAEADIVPGGWIKIPRRCHLTVVETREGWAQIHSVRKSNVTGHVTSVTVMATDPYSYGKDKDEIKLRTVKVNRLTEESYRAPTSEDLEKFRAEKKRIAALKKQLNAKKPAKPKLINPTIEDARKLQEILNAQRDSDDRTGEVEEITQAAYSAASKGTYAPCKADEITEKLELYRPSYYGGSNQHGQRVAFKVRMHRRNLIVLKDKPQKPIPWELCEAMANEKPSFIEAVSMLRDFQDEKDRLHKSARGLVMKDKLSDEMRSTLETLLYHELAVTRTVFDWGLSPKGKALLAKQPESQPA